MGKRRGCRNKLKFFHAHATIKHRKNSITTLHDSLGTSLLHHEQKADLLWKAFKEKMGISEFNGMLFNLGSLFQPVDGLDQLEAPFSKEEINKVVNNLPNNKSPSRDDFSNEFVKGCWLLNFEKAFDKIEHGAILEILKAKGFGQRWLSCVQGVLSSGSSYVLLNGVPGKVFQCKRGVRQGDPLSPLIFVLAADLLQSMLNKAKDLGLLNLKIPLTYTIDFLII